MMNWFWYRMKPLSFFASAIFFLLPAVVSAGMLYRVSDTLSSSVPGMMSTHLISFTTANAVPPSGRILVTLDEDFNIPVSFNYSDMDLAVAASSGAPFIERSLSDGTDPDADMVTVMTGTGSYILIELNITTGIGVGEIVQIELGTNAKFEGMGDQLITNPDATGTFRVDIETLYPAGDVIDKWNTLVALVDPVGMGPINTIDDSVPVISNVLPPKNLLIAGGTRNVQIALNTSENTTCKYSETQGTPYASMVNFFNQRMKLLHTVTMSGLVDDTTYTIYIVCADMQNNRSAEYEEIFSIGVVPLEPGTGGIKGPILPIQDGTGGGPLDYGGQYLGTAQVSLEGYAPPGSDVTILRDGSFEKKITAGASGIFNATVENLTRGTYTFGIFAEDTFKRRSSTYTTTISVNADTGNAISRIYVPPTIAVGKTTLDPGEPLDVFGSGIPGSSIEVFVGKQIKKIGSGDVTTATTTVAKDGSWGVSFSTTGFALETYEVKARGTVSGEDPGDFSASVFVGVGAPPNPDFSLRADLNKDGKVNIVDFSILLFNWDTADTVADINLDGNVGLTDFSIMLFYWTG